MELCKSDTIVNIISGPNINEDFSFFYYVIFGYIIILLTQFVSEPHRIDDGDNRFTASLISSGLFTRRLCKSQTVYEPLAVSGTLLQNNTSWDNEGKRWTLVESLDGLCKLG